MRYQGHVASETGSLVAIATAQMHLDEQMNIAHARSMPYRLFIAGASSECRRCYGLMLYCKVSDTFKSGVTHPNIELHTFLLLYCFYNSEQVSCSRISVWPEHSSQAFSISTS